MEFMGKTFPEAVELLIRDRIPDRPAEQKVSSLPEFRLPPKNENNDTVLRYLTEERGLDRNLVGAFLMSGDIYEDAEHHNCVFVGRDGIGIPRCASIRGTKERFRQDVSGSDKSCGFSYMGTGNKLFVFEAPIDLLSFICLYPEEWRTRSYCSLGGVSPGAMERILAQRKDIDQVFLCLDNDEAGNKASFQMTGSIPDTVAVTRLIPARKDWNDVLKEMQTDGRTGSVAERFIRKRKVDEISI